jgi:hypothetical protein
MYCPLKVQQCQRLQKILTHFNNATIHQDTFVVVCWTWLDGHGGKRVAYAVMAVVKAE